jgi:acyl dehydratase
MNVFDDIDQLRESVGRHLGHSDWHTVTQEQINLFAEATGDRQWIHVDPDRSRQGPFGATVAHGHLTLSLVPYLVAQIYRIEGRRMAVNYGLNRVRFPSPTPVDSRIRAGAELLSVEPHDVGSQVTLIVTVEREGSEKPVCVAETVALVVV